jgi:hypothetical protein
MDCTRCQNLSNLTHQGIREMLWILQDVRTCLIWHTKGSGKCVGLYLLTKIKPEYSIMLYNPTHFPDPLVCQIRQVLTSCTIQHISLVPWCVRLDRIWHPVQSNTFPWSLGGDTPRDQGNVSDCTGCLNLSNLTHQGIREMFQKVFRILITSDLYFGYS